MKSIVFATLVSDAEWEHKSAIPLQRSAHYFQPDIPFQIHYFHDIQSYDPASWHGIMDAKAILGEHLAKDFEQIVIFDADQLVVATLDEILLDDYDIAAVRNRSDHNTVHLDPNVHWFQVEGMVNLAQYMNIGIVSCRHRTFFTEWKHLNQQVRRFDLDQGTFNMLAYNGHYRAKMLDPPEAPYYYGVANSWGEKTPWDSWKTIALEDNKLYMNNIYGTKKHVKVLHKAGSGRMAAAADKFTADLFQSDVYDYLRRIMS
jgi:hypothetical protein